MLDRKLWYYKDRNEFYWDVTGSFWNLVVSQAVATVRLPVDVNPLGQSMFIGYPPKNLTDRYSTITKDRRTNALGFTATTPLFAGEGMHILISIPKAGFIEPDFNKNLNGSLKITATLYSLSSACWQSFPPISFPGASSIPTPTRSGPTCKNPGHAQDAGKRNFRQGFLLFVPARFVPPQHHRPESRPRIPAADQKTDNLSRLNPLEKRPSAS